MIDSIPGRSVTGFAVFDPQGAEFWIVFGKGRCRDRLFGSQRKAGDEDYVLRIDSDH
jgi:hypothetical protein